MAFSFGPLNFLNPNAMQAALSQPNTGIGTGLNPSNLFNFGQSMNFPPVGQSPVIDIALPSQTPGKLGGGFLDMFTADNMKGIGAMGEGIAGIWGAMTAADQLKQMEKMFDFSSAVTQRNLANQSRMLNIELADRNDSRRAFHGGDANPNNPYQKTGDYMAKNAISEDKIRA